MSALRQRIYARTYLAQPSLRGAGVLACRLTGRPARFPFRRQDAAPASVPNGGASRLTITPLGQGSNAITGQDILGRTYQVQYVTDPQATNWQTLGTATTDSSGTFQFIDWNAAPQRFYRTVDP